MCGSSRTPSESAASPQKVRKKFTNRYQLPTTINDVSAGQSHIRKSSTSAVHGGTLPPQRQPSDAHRPVNNPVDGCQERHGLLDHLVQRAQDQSGHASAVQSGRANPTAERLLGTPSISRRPERGACRVALPAAWICALRWRSARAHQEWARSPAPRGVHRPRRQPRLHRDRAIENCGSTCSTQAAPQDPWRVHTGYTSQP